MMALSFSWPLLRKPVMWGTLAWFACLLVFGLTMWALVVMPDKWSGAVAIKVCGDLPIVQQEDGSVWLLRRGWRPYRVKDDDASRLC